MPANLTHTQFTLLTKIARSTDLVGGRTVGGQRAPRPTVQVLLRLGYVMPVEESSFVTDMVLEEVAITEAGRAILVAARAS